MSSRPYHKHLAAILHKAQGVIDHETRKDIDIGGEVMALREWCDESATALREQADRIAALEAENERLQSEAQRWKQFYYAQQWNPFDEDGQRVLMGLARHCDSQAMLCKYGQPAVEWAQRAEIVRDYARQRAQAEGSGQ